jgi:hypothetical protein
MLKGKVSACLSWSVIENQTTLEPYSYSTIIYPCAHHAIYITSRMHACVRPRIGLTFPNPFFHFSHSTFGVGLNSYSLSNESDDYHFAHV